VAGRRPLRGGERLSHGPCATPRARRCTAPGKHPRPPPRPSAERDSPDLHRSFGSGKKVPPDFMQAHPRCLRQPPA